MQTHATALQTVGSKGYDGFAIALVIEQFDGSARRRAPYRKPRAIASPAMRPVVHAD